MKKSNMGALDTSPKKSSSPKRSAKGAGSSPADSSKVSILNFCLQRARRRNERENI